MDFELVLRRVHEFFAGSDRPWAVVGGLAMVAYGLGRTTLDVDLLASALDQDDLIGFLNDLEYDTLYRSTGFSNHQHVDPSMGRVDVVYVRGQTAARVFANRRWVTGPGGLDIPVPSPEHLAAMKIFSIRNDPRRASSELADVRFLLGVDGVDRAEIEAAFDRYDLGELRERLDD